MEAGGIAVYLPGIRDRNCSAVSGAEEMNTERGERVRKGADRDKMDSEKADRNREGREETDRNKRNGDRTGRHEAESSLALRVLEACRNQLFLRHRFLEQALFRLEWEEADGFSFGSDGACLYYENKYILKRYIQGPQQVSQDYLHTVMHCLYQHPFFCPQNHVRESEIYWNLAADIAVECVLEEMGEASVSENTLGKRSEILQRLRDEIGFISAQKIFHYLEKNALREESENIFGMDFHSLCGLFKRDKHALWYKGRDGGESTNGEARDSKNTEDAEEEISRTAGDGESRQEEHFAGNRAETAERSRKNLQNMWKNVADRVLVEAQTFAHAERGEVAGSLLQNLKKITRETYDYSRFLMKFASHREERMQIDEDEFDYAFYTYGMKLYGKVPLIEPLEYKEKNLIREFLIAIDTSGSCQGEAVEGFLTKTYNILRQAQAFTTRVNIHIVQCDACIQEDARISSQKELEEYIAGLTLKGFGGTDFTPVFEYADRLLETGEIRRLDGLLYFTDGYGIFPARPPGYRTAFVFLDKAEDVRVPSWAMKVYLDS